MPQQVQEARRPIRRDPEPRRIHGTSPAFTRLKNRRPDRHYVVVNPNDPDAMAEYTAQGYVVEITSNDKDALTFEAGVTSKEGEPLSQRGGITMSIDKEEHARIIREGADGQSGLNLADIIERKLTVNRALSDPLRGMSGLMGSHGIPFITFDDKPDK
jgi:hypothetical protein